MRRHSRILVELVVRLVHARCSRHIASYRVSASNQQKSKKRMCNNAAHICPSNALMATWNASLHRSNSEYGF
ncbi:hypothetical protein GQ44DRAFT_710058 [Phaeosphaeriaceae sp. PMI808]|nr:hypothetical protein GQ44DRAFT_710058 [Phaeosphaeriaceae sp. PMI808]